MSTTDDAVRIGRALADLTRVRILVALTAKELCVCELTALLGLRQPTVSRHLGALRAAGLVEDVREGQWVNYRLREAGAPALARTLLRGLAAAAARDPAAAELRRRARRVDRRRLRDA